MIKENLERISNRQRLYSKEQPEIFNLGSMTPEPIFLTTEALAILSPRS